MPESAPFRRLLIANRGEIAVRIIRACREMGISPVAVYSDADSRAPHVYLADSAVRIGAGPSSESYLRIDAVLEAAHASGAEAIHPGYGFLSENAVFAQACRGAGITFIGPSPEAIRALGDKAEAKRRLAAAGVPVVPGCLGEDQSLVTLEREAKSIGLPLLIKAAAGGGGRGMRLVRAKEELAPSIDEARREAEAAFGDGRLLLERFLERPRHVEFQIFGDSFGSVIHVHERECSIQRRHQKIIEESPSPIMTPDLRERMAEAAVTAGRAFAYCGAGTVEFLVQERANGEPEFYFLEVNTRLQVEHPVTEMRTGLDLVRMQIEVAGGAPIRVREEEVRPAGHAIEARIYAEDAEAGFLPSIGTLRYWREPSGPGIRVDSGVETGSEVSPYYDPMLAKLIAHGPTRESALARLEQALLHFDALGVRTNISFLLAVIRDPEFRAGRTHTGLLAERFAGWKASAAPPVEVMAALAANTLLPASARPGAPAAERGEDWSPWRTPGSWRAGAGLAEAQS